MGFLDFLVGARTPEQRYARLREIIGKMKSAKTAKDLIRAGYDYRRFVDEPRNLPALVRAIQDPDQTLHYNVAESLAEWSESPAAIEALKLALNDSDERVRKCATDALQKRQVTAK